jgi:hypothetical protein
VLPLTVTELTTTDVVFTVTANAVVAAVVALRASLYVKVKIVPAVFTAAELYTGAVISAVELFVTLEEAREIASLPAES